MEEAVDTDLVVQVQVVLMKEVIETDVPSDEVELMEEVVETDLALGHILPIPSH